MGSSHNRSPAVSCIMVWLPGPCAWDTRSGADEEQQLEQTLAQPQNLPDSEQALENPVYTSLPRV